MTTELHDYQRIERAIAFLDSCGDQPASVAGIAAAVGLSESRFHHLFRRFAGISPMRFLQLTTAREARRRLEAARPVLEVALETGLSSAGRLHDLMVNVEALTPGEISSGAAGLTLRYGVHDSRFGSCLLVVSKRGICGLRFLGPIEAGDALAALSRLWPAARLVEDPDGTAPVMAQVERWLDGRTGARPAVVVHGTNFQLRVWAALLAIPPGQVASYQRIASAIAQPTASRAVGRAVGDNPVAALIPCHRVIRSTGIFGGYNGGTLRKRAMLATEWAGADQADAARGHSSDQSK